ncbi:MAG: hypothetical protein ACLQDY_13490 [Streptosporangiaceae bacterium]
MAAMHLPRPLAPELRAWDAKAGGKALAAVSNELGDATQDAVQQFYSPMKFACAALKAAVASAKAGPQIPDGTLQGRYGTALGTLARGAADCTSAIAVHPYGDEDLRTDENSSLIRKSMTLFAVGSRELYLATVLVHLAARR